MTDVPATIWLVDVAGETEPYACFAPDVEGVRKLALEFGIDEAAIKDVRRVHRLPAEPRFLYEYARRRRERSERALHDHEQRGDAGAQSGV